jgi:hypothetical protein
VSYLIGKADQGRQRARGQGHGAIEPRNPLKAMDDTQRERRAQPERQDPQNPLAVEPAPPNPHSTSRTRNDESLT